MGSITVAWNITSSALDADQAALNILANNVANASTPGYTREVPVWQENDPLRIAGRNVGNGAAVTGAESERDRVLEQRIQQQTQASSGSSARLAALASLEALFTPATGSSTTGTGDLGTAISGFFNSFSQLESNPADPSLRQQVLSTAQTLAGEFNGLSSSLSAQQAALDQQAANSTSAVNGLLTAVATLNQRIAGLAPGADAGTLEDQRQQDLASLSSLIGFDTIRTENNGLTLTTAGGTALVSGGQAVSLSTGLVGGETHFFAGGTDITDDLRGAGGAVGGLLTVRDQDIPQAIGSLDVLAYGIASGVNSANNAGSDLAGDVSGAGDIFAIPGTAAGSAAAISVVMTDPAHIAAAASGAGPGDASNAAVMAALGSSATIAGQTPTAYFSSLLSSIGSSVSAAQSVDTANQASLSQLTGQRNALSETNLNDEASAISDLERSYQAASKVFSILNQVLASALNLGTPTTVS